MSSAKRRALKHGIAFTLTRQDILNINKTQKGLCVYSGVTLNWNPTHTGKQRVCPPDRASLDRIVPSLGYIPSNVQLVTDFANRMKTWYPHDDFIEFCRMVVRHIDNP